MPSWNIHTAHVERLLADHDAASLGIADSNAFLFGNYVPDVYLGFMVPDTTYRIDYCLTHYAQPDIIPVPDADRFWDECIWHAFRKAKTPSGVSLALGTWAHLAADRMYNSAFREFCHYRDTPEGDELRVRKQSDFHLFGHSLRISSTVEITPDLLDAAKRFRPYSILPDDVARAVDVASAIVRGVDPKLRTDVYQLLSPEWMTGTFEACNDFLASWLTAWQRLEGDCGAATASDVRAAAGLGCQPPSSNLSQKRDA